MFSPIQVLGMWIRGLLTVLMIGAGIFLLVQWYNHRQQFVLEQPEAVNRIGDKTYLPDEQKTSDDTRIRVVEWQFGLNRETAFLLGGLALVAFSLGGGLVFSPVLWRRRGEDDPQGESIEQTQRLRRPDGSDLRIGSIGSAEADPIVFIHGWGLDSQEWVYAKRELGERYRLITFDLPGLGGSSRPTDRNWSLERLAEHLDAVIDTAGGKPVVLVGHSIGVMIILTYCKRFPEALGRKVRSLVLAHGTYTNPMRTTSKPKLHTALQKPVLEPLCHVMIWLAPVVRVLSWLSYLNGSAHRSTERDSFSGKETRGQLDFITRYYCKSPPDVLGRGMLAMFRYDATSTLGRINIPTLVVAGDKDGTCTPEASRFIAERVPGAELFILTSAKHCGLFEHHRQFNQAIAEFLRRGTVVGVGKGAASMLAST